MPGSGYLKRHWDILQRLGENGGVGFITIKNCLDNQHVLAERTKPTQKPLPKGIK